MLEALCSQCDEQETAGRRNLGQLSGNLLGKNAKAAMRAQLCGLLARKGRRTWASFLEAAEDILAQGKAGRPINCRAPCSAPLSTKCTFRHGAFAL